MRNRGLRECRRCQAGPPPQQRQGRLLLAAGLCRVAVSVAVNLAVSLAVHGPNRVAAGANDRCRHGREGHAGSWSIVGQ